MSMGLTAVLVKQLTARDDPDKIVFLTNALLMPLSLVPALFVWSWPTLQCCRRCSAWGCARCWATSRWCAATPRRTRRWP